MKSILAAAIVVLLANSGSARAPDSTFGGIQLLDGYSAHRKWAVDAAAWEILSKDHFTIYFEAGDGSWADPKEMGKYAWYRERVVRKHTVRFALVKPGLKTQWDRKEDEGSPPGNILLVSYILWSGTKLYPDHCANFSAKIKSPGELGDALLMILTFDPSEGKF